jgi:methionyl-tRNA formyltransferase
MNIVFIGASGFGLRCLEQIINLDNCKVAGVVTAPQVFSISYKPSGVKNVLYADMSTLCKENDIPCAVMEGAMSDPALLEQVQTWKPDVFIVSGWYHMVPKSWRKLAPAYGLHASLLPDYSGGAPLVWAIINGEEKTGISFFQFADGVDNGPLVGQEETVISYEDTIKTLYARIEDLGLKLLKDHVPKLADGSAEFTVQNENHRRLYPQRSPEDGVIDWSWPAKQVYDFVRAQTKPYPGAFTVWNDRKVTIWSCDVSIETYSEVVAGQVITEKDEVLIVCGDNKAIKIYSLAVDGVDACPADLNSFLETANRSKTA